MKKSTKISNKQAKPAAEVLKPDFVGMGKKNRIQRHFRKFHSKETTGHPSYVFDEQGNKYKVIGITSGEKTNGILNIKLDKNPEPNNIRDAYIQPKIKQVPKGTKNEKLKGWKFADSDKKKVQKIIDKDKK